MNLLRLCKTIAGTAALSLALMHAPANAAIVDFDTTPDPATTFSQPGGTSIDSGGYTFLSTSNWAVINGDALPYGVSNGTNMLVFANAGALTVTQTGGGLFALSALDVGGWLGLPAGSNAQFSIVGHTASGDLPPIMSGLLSTTSFATVLTPGLTNLQWLTLSLTGYPAGSYYGAIDNLILTAVPEPETYAMLLAGLGLLAVVARRRKAS